MPPNKINYVEFPSRDLVHSRAFFQEVFGWSFTDYGPNYSSFSDAGLDGGFFSATQASLTSNGAALIVLYSDDLENTLEKVKKGGGDIAKEIFSFPGGRRFHFIEPGGNELAVWSDKDA